MLGNILVGRYQIVKYLGGGGFGETFVARDTQLPSSPQCVVKKLKPQSNDPVTLETARRLFDTEAQVLYKLGTHDRIPQLLAYFEEKEEFYLVQEYIEGHDLTEELTLGKALSQDEVIPLLKEILSILEFVHGEKVIHRDINPRNLLRRNSDGKLILIDFGAVKQIVTKVMSPLQQTKFTVAIGTPGYIPGEQAQGNPKFSSDIYAVGIIGITALTGLSPEQLDRDAESNEIVWQNQAQLSQNFAEVLDKMVRYDFRERYSSATIALQALNDLDVKTSLTTTFNFAPIQSNPKNIPKKVNKKGLIVKIISAIGLLGAGVVASIYIVNNINSTNAIELSKQGNTLYDLQRYPDALATYEKAVEIRPDYPQAWDGQGKTLYELKKYKQALTAYDKAIQLQPLYLEAWSGRGFTLNKLQRYREAIASFEKALEVENKDPKTWNARGEALMNLKEYDQAIKSFEKAIEFKSDYPEAWYNKAWVLQSLKRYDQAIAAYDKSLEFKPNYEQAWYNRGNALVNLNRYQDAFAAYDKAVEYKPDYSEAWLSRSNVLMNLQRYPEAVESFNQAVKFNPNNYQAWYSRGWSLHQIQRDDDAIESYNKAISLKKNDYQVFYNKGNSLYNLKKYQDALTSYNRAIRLKPDNSESWFSRGNVFLNLKRYQEAIASYDQAIKFKSDYRQAIDARNQAQKELEAEKLKLVVPTIQP